MTVIQSGVIDYLVERERITEWYMTLQKADHTWEKCRRESWPPKFRTDIIECLLVEYSIPHKIQGHNGDSNTIWTLRTALSQIKAFHRKIYLIQQDSLS
jgi:hypothetical protein